MYDAHFSGLLPSVTWTVVTQIMADRPLFVYPDFSAPRNTTAGCRSHSFETMVLTIIGDNLKQDSAALLEFDETMMHVVFTDGRVLSECDRQPAVVFRGAEKSG
jgi:hypothetical protein